MNSAEFAAGEDGKMKKCLDKLCSDHNIDEPNWCDSRVDVVTCYKKPPLMDDSEPVANFRCSGGLSDIDPYNLECLATEIVNHVNERTGVDVKKRQETNDENFDHVIKQVKAFLKENGR